MKKSLLSLFSCALATVPLAAVLTPNAVQAQGGFQKGYIVSLAGDTVYGSVAISRAARASQICAFKEEGQKKGRNYKPSEVRGYGTSQLALESQLVPSAPDVAAKPAELQFLEVAAEGALKLYVLNLPSTLNEADKTRYFLGGYRRTLVELTERVTPMQRGQQQYLYRQPMFQDTLARAFRACPSQAPNVKRYTLTTQSLQEAVEAYNNCVAPPQAVTRKKPKRGHIAFGVVGGFAFSDKLTLGEGNNTNELDAEYDGKSYVLGGLEVVFTPGFANSPFTVHTGLLFEQGRTFTSTAIYNPAIVREYVRLQFNYVVLPVMGRYSVGKGLVHYYAEAGGSLRFLSKTIEDEKTIQFVYTGSDPKTTMLLQSYQSINGGIGAGLGVELHFPAGQLSAGLRTERMTGPSKYTSGSSMQNLLFLVGYTFAHRK